MCGDRIGNLDKCLHQQRPSSINFKGIEQDAAFNELMKIYYLFKSNRILNGVDLVTRENHWF